MFIIQSFVLDFKYVIFQVIQVFGFWVGFCILLIVWDGKKVSSIYYYLLFEWLFYLECYQCFLCEVQSFEELVFLFVFLLLFLFSILVFVVFMVIVWLMFQVVLDFKVNFFINNSNLGV